MSSSAARQPQLSSVPKTEPVDASLQKKIEETRRLLKHADISLSLLSLGTIILIVLLLSVLADHWLFKNGLSVSLRFGVFSSLLLFSLIFIYKRIVPFFLYPINPVYAADALERNSPSIKNALLNWILLRRERPTMPPNSLSERVLESIAQAAVKQTNSISTDRAVDRGNLARLGSVFISLIILFIAYTFFSPKNPLTSMARIIMPFSSIQTPQSVQFRDIFPDNCKLVQGEKTEVSVRVVGRGNQENDSVYLFFSRDDGQAIEQAVPMNFLEAAPNGGARYSVPFPPGKQGLVCGIDYWFVLGSSRSETYRMDIVPVASLEIASLLYRYPDYTGLPEEIVEGGGDIRAVEGSEVRIGIRSSLPLEQAWLAFGKDPRQSMQVFGENQTEARKTVLLPNYSNEETRIRNFAFHAIDRNGNENRPSPVFRMEVLPDRPPIVRWSDADDKINNVAQIEVPLNGSIELSVQAEDPDFGLRYLRFHVESGNQLIHPVDLLESPLNGPTEHKGNISKTVVFSPTNSRLSVGNTAEIWVEAVDTRLPEPNVSTTSRINVRVLESRRKDERKEQTESENQKNKQQDKQDKENSQGEQNPDSKRNESEKTDDQKNQSADKESAANSSKNDSGEGENKQQEQQQQQQQATDEGSADRNDSSQNDQENNRQNGDQKDNQGDGKPQDESQGQDNGQQDKQQGGQTQQSQNPDENREGQENDAEQRKSADAEKDPGEAFDRIIEHMKENGKFPPENDPQNSQQDTQHENPKDHTEDQRQENKQESEQKPQQNQEQPNRDQQPGQGDQQKQPKNSEQQQSDCENGQGDGDSQGSGNSGSKPKSEEQGNGQGGQNGETQETEQNSSRGGDPSQQSSDSDSSEQDGEGESDGKQETQKRQEDRNQNEGQNGQEDDQNGEQGSGGNKNRSPKKESESGSTSGGDQQGDPNSDQEKRKGDDRNEDRRDVPVDPSDQTPRKRDDSLDPDTKDRRNQGGDSTDPKETKRDIPTDTLSGGDEGKGQETNQQGQSDRTQTSESGKRGDQGSEGVEQEGGSSGQDKTSKQSGQRDESEHRDSDKQDGTSNDPQSEQGQSPKESSQGSGQNSDQQQADQGETQAGEEGQTGGMPSNSSSKSSSSNPSGSEDAEQPENNLNESGTPTGGRGDNSFGHQETEKEAVNQEYAEKIGNLVLEYLEDQLKDTPNQELLDKLGWTEDQLREYHEKWKEMSKNSRQNAFGSESEQESEAAKKAKDDWKEFLKSLDLKPNTERQHLQDSKTRYQDGGKATEFRRYAPPSKLRERFKNYTKGIGQ